MVGRGPVKPTRQPSSLTLTTMSDKEYSRFIWVILAMLIAAAFIPGWKAFAAMLGWMVVITLTDIHRAIQNKDKDLHE